jgi:hypothetical protein
MKRGITIHTYQRAGVTIYILLLCVILISVHPNCMLCTLLCDEVTHFLILLIRK